MECELKKLSIVLPVYNEKNTFEILLNRLIDKRLEGFEKEIIIVESGSTDGTKELVEKYRGKAGIKIILQDRPRGKGNAVREGFSAVTGDIIIIQDADLEYDINDYDKLLEPIVAGRADFVLGSRHLEHKTWQIRKFTNNLLTALAMNIGHQFFRILFNLFYGVRLIDPFTMFKVFKSDIIKGIDFECDRFDFDFELVSKLIRRGHKPIEIPVSYMSRHFSDGKKVSFIKDPPTWLVALIKYRFFWK